MGEIHRTEDSLERHDLRTPAIDLTPGTQGFVESRLLSALGRFTTRIKSVAVHLEARRSRTQSDTAACGIVVSLHPSGMIRSGAEDSRMHAAIDRATAAIGAQVEREVMRTRRSAASTPVVGERLHDRAMELVQHDDRISQQQREMLERPENYLRPIRVREYWRPSKSRRSCATLLEQFVIRPMLRKLHILCRSGLSL
jgi:ribosomal subunit interface protein